MTLLDVARRYAAILDANVSLKGWSMSTFGKVPKIYVGVNLKKPPGADDCPAIVIIPQSVDAADVNAPPTGNILVGWNITNGETSEVGNIVMLRGLEDAEAFAGRIFDILNEDSPTTTIISAQFQFDAVDAFPQFPGYMDLQIRYW